MVEVETLRCGRTPIVTNGDDIVGDFFMVENLSDAVGLSAVVVVLRVGRFGGVAKTEQVEDDEGIREVEESWDCACPHVCIVRVAVDEHERRDILIQLLVEVRG